MHSHFLVKVSVNMLAVFIVQERFTVRFFLTLGIATSSVGAATNIGTSIVEKLLNSKQVTRLFYCPFFLTNLLFETTIVQVKDLNAAFERDKMLTTKFERQIEEVETIFVFANFALNRPSSR